jgi:predicted  nucleic acid-binding Zn-ribbon protein
MPDLPQDPTARLEKEIRHWRERAAQLEKELAEVRAEVERQRAAKKPPSDGAEPL